MGSLREFNDMLNEYLAVDLLRAELVKNMYSFEQMNKDDSWKGGAIPIPFEGQSASSVEFGQLPATTDISSFKYKRGYLQQSDMTEVWGSLKFRHRDLIEHDGKVNEKSFLRMLPGQINDFITYFKTAIAVNLLAGPHFATLTVDGTVGGVIEVDKVNRFQLDQKVVLDDGNSIPSTFYVVGIDINGGTLKKGAITLSGTRGGVAGTADPVTTLQANAYTVAQSAKVYHPGAQANSFNSVGNQILAAANGGSATLYGFTKTAYPFLQAVQTDGSAISSGATLIAAIFDGYTRRQILGKPSASLDVVMSYKLFGLVLKALEASGNTDTFAKGQFNITPGSRKVSVYGWQQIQIGSVTGDLMTLTALQEMEDDRVYYLDWSGFTFFSNGLIRRQEAPDGQQYTVERSVTDGFAYILDHCVFGQMVCTSPWKQAVLHSIPLSLSL
jgi:hypothetical protein